MKYLNLLSILTLFTVSAQANESTQAELDAAQSVTEIASAIPSEKETKEPSKTQVVDIAKWRILISLPSVVGAYTGKGPYGTIEEKAQFIIRSNIAFCNEFMDYKGDKLPSHFNLTASLAPLKDLDTQDNFAFSSEALKQFKFNIEDMQATYSSWHFRDRPYKGLRNTIGEAVAVSSFFGMLGSMAGGPFFATCFGLACGANSLMENIKNDFTDWNEVDPTQNKVVISYPAPTGREPVPHIISTQLFCPVDPQMSQEAYDEIIKQILQNQASH